MAQDRPKFQEFQENFRQGEGKPADWLGFVVTAYQNRFAFSNAEHLILERFTVTITPARTSRDGAARDRRDRIVGYFNQQGSARETSSMGVRFR